MEKFETQEERIARLQGEVIKREDNKKIASSIVKCGLLFGLVSLCMLFPKVTLSNAQQATTEEEIKMEQNIDDMYAAGIIGTTLSAATIAIAGSISSKEGDKLSKARRELQYEYE